MSAESTAIQVGNMAGSRLPAPGQCSSLNSVLLLEIEEEKEEEELKKKRQK